MQNLDEGFILQLFISLQRSDSVMKFHMRLFKIIHIIENLVLYI